LACATQEEIAARTVLSQRTVWQRDVERVLGWVKAGLGMLEDPVRVLEIERWMEYSYPGNGECPPFRLRHRIDLIIEHADGPVVPR
jgi:hypothetical protein